MNIVERHLTLTQNTGTNTVNCVAGCRVELTPFESASLLAPNAQGFRLRCVLLGIDPGPDDTIFTYPKSKTFTNIVDLLNVTQVFESDVSHDVLNEDVNGPDEIRAEFTLTNLSTGQSVVRRSNLQTGNFQ